MDLSDPEHGLTPDQIDEIELRAEASGRSVEDLYQDMVLMAEVPLPGSTPHALARLASAVRGLGDAIVDALLRRTKRRE